MTPLQELLSELSFRSGLSIPAVEKELKKWRKKAESNSTNEPVTISGVGTFIANQNGNIGFTVDSLLMDLVNYRYAGLVPIALNSESSETNVPNPVSIEAAQTKESEKSPKSSGSAQAPPAKSKKKSLFAVGFLLVISLVATAWFMAPNLPFLDFFVTDKGNFTEGSKTIVTMDSPSSEVPASKAESTVLSDEAAVIPQSIDATPVETASQESSLYGLFGEFNEELSGSFTISVFSFSDIDNASEQASVLLSEGYRLNIRTVWNGGGTIWQLTVGQFESREEAESALGALSKTQFPESTIISYP